MKKLIMVKDSGKIIWGDRKFQCRPIVKCVVKGIDLRNKLQKRRRTYWMWITFEGRLCIRLGDTRVVLEDKNGIRLRENIFYHKIEREGKPCICQFVSKQLNTMNFLGMKPLVKNEEFALVYTEIESSQVDRREQMITLIDTMRRALQDYQMHAFMSYEKSPKIDGKCLRKRLYQIERIDQELNAIKGHIRDIYKVVRDKNLYFDIEIKKDGYEINAHYDF